MECHTLAPTGERISSVWPGSIRPLCGGLSSKITTSLPSEAWLQAMDARRQYSPPSTSDFDQQQKQLHLTVTFDSSYLELPASVLFQRGFLGARRYRSLNRGVRKALSSPERHVVRGEWGCEVLRTGHEVSPWYT